MTGNFSFLGDEYRRRALEDIAYGGCTGPFMSCEATPPRLSAVKQTYGRVNKKSPSNVTSGSTSERATCSLSAQPVLLIERQPLGPDDHTASDLNECRQTLSCPNTPSSSKSIPQLSPARPQIKPKQTSLFQFVASPRQMPPKTLQITPPRSVPNILRRTPVKQSGGSTRKPTTPKSTKTVNLSPVLYSPKVKNKNPFFGDVPCSGYHTDHSSVIRVVRQNPTLPRRSVGSQCNIKLPLTPSSKPSPKPVSNCVSPRKQNLLPNFKGEKVLCDVEMQSEDMVVVSHSINGRIYSGVLIADSYR